MSLRVSSSNNGHRFSAASQRTIQAIGWQGRLNDCADEAEVLGLVKDHIAQLSLDELSQLPDSLRPPRLVDADDVSSYAFLLAREHQLGENCEVLEKLAGFITNAARRLSQVLFRSRNSRAGDHKAA